MFRINELKFSKFFPLHFILRCPKERINCPTPSPWHRSAPDWSRTCVRACVLACARMHRGERVSADVRLHSLTCSCIRVGWSGCSVVMMSSGPGAGCALRMPGTGSSWVFNYLFLFSVWPAVSRSSSHQWLISYAGVDALCCHWCIVSRVGLGWHMGKSSMTWTTASCSITYRHYFDIIVILYYKFSVLTGRFRAKNRRVRCPPAGAAAASNAADRNF